MRKQTTTNKQNSIFPLGINPEVVRKISEIKKEPEWMLDYRLKAYDTFVQYKQPQWGPDLSKLDFGSIKYYAYAGEKSDDWRKVPDEIRDTFEKLGVPDIEQKYLAGLTTQYESEAIYHNLKQQWSSMGIVFEDTDTALKKYEKYFVKYFGKLVPYTDNKYAALNTAVWSGGTFIYVPKGVKLYMPVQTYFRINTVQMGQFERTLIIADEDSEIHYIEGCTAPQYMKSSLHAAVVEIYAMKNAHLRYTTIQNWSKNVYNLVTKRAIAEDSAKVEWVDCNIGSAVTMKYPAVILKGNNSRGTLLSMALAGDGQNIDSGGKMIHIGDHTKSVIKSKTVSKGTGIATYRGISKIAEGASHSQSSIECESILLDESSKAYSYPIDECHNSTSVIEHEAYVSKLSEDKMIYLQSRGINPDDARHLIVSGFISDVTNELPTEYSVELERILQISI